jgi:hypothetical protein
MDQETQHGLGGPARAGTDGIRMTGLGCPGHEGLSPQPGPELQSRPVDNFGEKARATSEIGIRQDCINSCNPVENPFYSNKNNNLNKLPRL